MKNIVIKFLKTLLVFIIATLIIYIGFVAKNYIVVCKEYQLGNLYNNQNIINLDKEKIKSLGENVKINKETLEADINKTNEERSVFVTEEGDVYSFAELYDPLGFAVRWELDNIIYLLFEKDIKISIFIGITITIAYTIITMKNISGIGKFIIGYLGIILIFPPLYMYSYTHRFWPLEVMYLYGVPKFFYIIYTLLFIWMYVINYIISSKLTKQLNEIVNDYSVKK